MTRCTPDLATFAAVAVRCAATERAVRIPVRVELATTGLDPLDVYRTLRTPGTAAALLETAAEPVRAHGASPRTRRSFIATNPVAVRMFRAGEDPLAYVETMFTEAAYEPCGCDIAGFAGGALMLIGYECAGLWERLPRAEGDLADMPDAIVLLADDLIAIDHDASRATAVTVATVRPGDDAARVYRAACERARDLARRALQPPMDDRVESAGSEATPIVHTTNPERFMAGVEQIRHEIHAGEVIQAVLSRRLGRRTDASPAAIYRALRALNPSPYMYLVELPDLAVVGASPELLVRCEHDGLIETRPIAGTRPRGATLAEDRALEAELLADPKERSEHTMLVDLGRNDLGRVAEIGSVAVDECMTVERFSHVMHLTSHVSARLHPDRTAFDALRACFPAGTVSGAPKLRAMEIVAALEPHARGLYAGAVGFAGYDGSLDTAIAIRTLVVTDGTAYVQAGAGIVADSDPARELAESGHKAQALLATLDAVGSGR